jgi:hypothetical protein
MRSSNFHFRWLLVGGVTGDCVKFIMGSNGPENMQEAFGGLVATTATCVAPLTRSEWRFLD